ncbi:MULTISPECIES: hypothetical protein [unclassified Neisseria]|uniref:hypothetical protein n=1 Tax=unclassified Neisseria TaxID=2623750 RepID=UPI002666DA7E|nr:MULTISPECIES: hypothetical protein [unclassified Neisseria]MDO1509556.1 hypothetical protein [Neisseria sp. MVDL19-042950]MDO1515672.1 hypothetical protein [Neisseria sp. MVDL18-041461]MDO1563504.1 hypothetical protein [Neisseria sp. MVDL20-010259]
MKELDTQIAATETGAAAAKETVAEAEHLRSERKSLFARLLSIGKTDFENSEVKELDAAIAAKRDQADRAADISAAQSELLERLYAERLELANRIEELRRLLFGSQYEMFIAEIEHEHIPEYLKAAETFAQAAAKLAGYGKAAAMMRDKLIENGIRTTAPAYGQHIPARAVDLRIAVPVACYPELDATGCKWLSLGTFADKQAAEQAVKAYSKPYDAYLIQQA